MHSFRERRNIGMGAVAHWEYRQRIGAGNANDAPSGISLRVNNNNIPTDTTESNEPNGQENGGENEKFISTNLQPATPPPQQ